MYKKLWLFSVFALGFLTTGEAKERLVRPDYVDVSAKADVVRNVAVRNMQAGGWDLEADGQLTLTFTQIRKSSSFLAMMATPSGCGLAANQKNVLVLTLYEVDGKTTLRERPLIEHPSSFCRLERDPWRPNKVESEMIYDTLQSIKNAAETPSANSISSTPSSSKVEDLEKQIADLKAQEKIADLQKQLADEKAKTQNGASPALDPLKSCSSLMTDSGGHTVCLDAKKP